MTADRRTQHWRDWDLPDLLAAKRERGATVSLVVPARNEVATVGEVVTRVRERLLETADLCDEIVVVDSDSTDGTYDAARRAGATVHRSRDIRPDLGSRPGKGEAMWKSQFVTSGDLLVFMDADLVEWDTHFVPGLLGPLLSEDAVALVKGCYERPMLDTGPAAATPASSYEGGRVTELVARPLIALDWPGLAWLAQPLAGEWAVRRSLFERLRVPTGYGVELAALIDTLQLLGPEAIAQVDLGRRAHTHQPLHNLGAMAVQVLAAAQARSGGPDRASDGAVSLRQYPGPRPVTREVAVDERPPGVDVRRPDEAAS